MAAGALGLSLAFAWNAEAATTEIVVSPLAVVSSAATGTVSGFGANATVRIDGRTLIANAAGSVALVSSPLDGDGVPTVEFTDADGMPQTVALDLRDSVTGLQPPLPRSPTWHSIPPRRSVRPSLGRPPRSPRK